MSVRALQFDVPWCSYCARYHAPCAGQPREEPRQKEHSMARDTEDHRCVKCGDRNAATWYVSAEDPFIPLARRVMGAKEWLRRTCRRCGYEWSERTLDTPDV